MATQQEVIRSFMKSLDKTSASGTVAINNAVKACSSFGSLQGVIKSLISDCKSATDAAAFLKEKCGIDLDNTDTGAITGSDAGGSTDKTAESIVPESGKASYPSGTSFTKRGLKVIVPKKSKLTKAQKIVVQGLYSWWIDSALELIEESYGYSFTDNDATVKKITLKFIDEPDSGLLAFVTPHLSSTNGSAYKADKLTLTVNMSRFENISADNVNGSEETYPFYLDRVLAHEFTHAIMAAKIDNCQDMPTFILEGMAELTHGIDDTRASDIEELVANPSQLETILNATAEPSTSDYAAGYIFLRYLAKQVSDGNDTIPGDENADQFIENTVVGAMIQTSSGNDTISNSAEKVTINAGAGNDEINNIGDSVTIDSGAGDDFIFNSNISIKDYPDRTEVSYEKGGDNVTINSGKGNDYVFSYGYNSSISTGDGDDTVHNCFYGDSATINTGKGNDYVENDKYAHGSKISLGAGNDTLINLSSNNITINGGKGKDLINLDFASTENVVEYKVGDGNDTVYGYNLTDTITLTGGSVTSESISGGNLILEIGSGSITFIDALNANVNGTIYGKSSKKGTSGKDYIVNIDSNAKLKAYKGNDTIANYGDEVLINAGKGNNNISNYGENSTIITGNGNNTIYNDGHYSSIVGGSGNDSINNNWSDDSTIEAGAGNDTILNYGVAVLRGGDGNDVIFDNGRAYSKINGGKGEDIIYNNTDWDGGEIIEYTEGDGNDVVYGYNSNDTIRISGTYTTSTVGNDVLVKVGDGSIRLIDAKDEKINILDLDNLVIKGTKGNDSIENIFDRTNIQALGGNDYISNSGSHVTIDAGAGNDEVYNYGSNVSVNGGTNNDEIWNGGSNVIIDGGKGNDNLNNNSNNVTINGGEGYDTIQNDSSNVMINGGTGNDYIDNYSQIVKWTEDQQEYETITSDNTTIEGGKGNDYIFNKDGQNVLFKYASGDGNDIIEGFNETSTLSIGEGKGTYSTEMNDSDVIVTVGKGKITLDGAVDLPTLNINGTDIMRLTLNNKSAAKVTLESPIKTADASSRTKSIQITGNKFANTISGGSKTDTIYGGADNDSILGSKGNDILYGQKGNDLILGGKGNDCIIGGKGNDSLWGDAGADNFIYAKGDGKDTIFGFDNKDTLTFDNLDFTTSYSASKGKIVFSVDGGSITLKEFTTTTFHVNDDIYKISGSKFVKK